MASHYTLLQVPEQASADELRQAFRRLSKRFHPDTTSLPASEAEQSFQRLRQAYAVLSDPDARRRYDAELRLARVAASAAAAIPASRPVNGPPVPPVTSVTSVRRALSGGEWLALLLLALALVFSLVLGVGLALARGAAFSTWPSWLPTS
ncbi:MAG: J domain-containing protein [Cyanobium sp.]